MTGFIALIAILGVSNVGLFINRRPLLPRQTQAVVPRYTPSHADYAQSASVNVVLSVRGNGAAKRAVAIAGALKQHLPDSPCSIFTDAAAMDELHRLEPGNQIWCDVKLLADFSIYEESLFARTALEFASVALRTHHFKSTIWVNGEALPSCAQLNAAVQQAASTSKSSHSSVVLTVPEVAFNLAEADWNAVPLMGISVSDANDTTRLAMHNFAVDLVDLIHTHAIRKVLPLRSAMLLFREAALRSQLQVESGSQATAVHLQRLTLTLPSHARSGACIFGSSEQDDGWLKNNAEISKTCSRLQTLGRTVALRNSRHATDAIDLPVLASALGVNASFRPFNKCSAEDCYTTKHPWEQDFRRVGKLEPLTSAEMRTVDGIYAPPDVFNQKSPSIAIITVLGAGELMKRRDGRAYMVRVKQLFAELSGGHISFQLFFAHELMCGDDDKTWAEIESLSYGQLRLPRNLSNSDLPKAVKEARARREAARAKKRPGLPGEFSKIVSVWRALEKNAREGGAEWVLLLDSDVWLHPNLLGTAALLRILSAVPIDKAMVVGNYRFFNTGFVAFRAKGVPGHAARELVRDWWAVASTPGAIECHAYDQAAAQALVLLRATNWTTTEPGGFTCTIDTKCGGNQHPVFRTCDQAYARGLISVGMTRFDRGDANDDPKVRGIFVLSESDRWPRPMCL
jgi:hypothetical protein